MTPGPDELARAARRLRAGGAVAFPTETVYGLGADAFSAAAVRRVYELKGRPSHNPLIVHVSGEAMARSVSAGWPGIAAGLAAAFWPGPLSLVLKAGSGVPKEVTAGQDTVAVRCPDHPVALALLEAFGGPLVGPSANPSGYVSPTRAEHVREHFTPEQVMVLDGGPCRAGIESTVVDLTSATPRVLRPGVIGADQIGEAIGGRVIAAGPAEAAGPGPGPRSPGLVGPHYQPRARVVLAARLTDIDTAIAEATGPACVLSPPGVPVAVDPPHASIPMPADAEAYAAALYAAFHDADAGGATVLIVVVPAVSPADPGEAAIWYAVLERLTRAAADADRPPPPPP